MLDTGYWALDTGCWMLDAGYWALDTGYIPEIMLERGNSGILGTNEEEVSVFKPIIPTFLF